MEVQSHFTPLENLLEIISSTINCQLDPAIGTMSSCDSQECKMSLNQDNHLTITPNLSGEDIPVEDVVAESDDQTQIEDPEDFDEPPVVPCKIVMEDRNYNNKKKTRNAFISMLGKKRKKEHECSSM